MLAKIFSIAAVGLFTSASQAQYIAGHVWTRYSEFVAGNSFSDDNASYGSWTNNPGPDSKGNPVWYYDWTNGDQLGGTNEWYKQPGYPLVWDSNWLSAFGGLWAKANDTYPEINVGGMEHNVQSTPAFNSVPRVRFRFPSYVSGQVNVLGTLRIHWGGSSGDVNVDVVVAKRTAAGSFSILWSSANVARPMSNVVDYNLGSQTALQGVSMALNDELIFSLRCRSANANQFVFLEDDGVQGDGSDRVRIVLDGLNAPGPCDADFNRDGVIDFFDYLDFVAAFEEGCE